jgi:hypothetical protein
LFLPSDAELGLWQVDISSAAVGMQGYVNHVFFVLCTAFVTLQNSAAKQHALDKPYKYWTDALCDNDKTATTNGH